MRQILLLIFLMPFAFYGQTQIGSDIDGETVNDLFGNSVSLSSNGNIVAIGAPNGDGVNGNDSGYVQVFSNNGSGWIQLGNNIEGEADSSGWSVSLSSDGTTVAIGATGNSSVRVYNYNGSAWVQVGDDIVGEQSSDLFGWSVSLSSDGNKVAIGGIGNDDNGISSGHVRIYSYNGSVWVQVGNDIDGEAAGDSSGYSVSLSSDASIVAIGARNNDGVNGIDSGHVRVFNYNGSSWVQMGNDVDGELGNTGLGFSDTFGFSVSLSSDGNMFAAGALYNDGVNGIDSGHVRVFNYNGSSWVQVGDDIDGEASGDASGRSISLSSDGNIVAIGATTNKANNINSSGHVRIFKNIANIWTQIGIDIDAEAEGDRLGHSVSLSSDGNIVAIGAILNDGINGVDSGHVRVYDLNAVLSTESFRKDYFKMYPNPAKNIINIEMNNGLELKQINIYNVLSQYLYSTKELKMDTNNLKSGIYFIEIVTDKGKSAKKVVIE